MFIRLTGLEPSINGYCFSFYLFTSFSHIINFSGKLQIRKSGRTQLLIGNMAMDVNFGTQVGFLQELVSINVPPPNEPEAQAGQQRPFGDMAVLGRVRHRLVVTPDWSKLFGIESSPEPEESSSDEEEPS